MSDRRRFPHHRLEVYRLALAFAVKVRKVVAQFPRGNARLADQATRASESTVLLIAEGANRRSWPDKRHRYNLARGENGEAAAALELAGACEFLDAPTTDELLDDAGHISAMLLNLARRAPPGAADTTEPSP